MKLLFLSLKLYSLGFVCDLSANTASRLAEKYIAKNQPLTKKLLIKISNFSDVCFARWQTLEQEFVRLLVRRHYYGI